MASDWMDALMSTCGEFFERPVIWGETDCCQFVRSYYGRLTGKDVDLPYDSEMGALRIVQQHGSMAGLFASILGESRAPEPGDVVVVRVGDEGEGAGVYNGSYVVGVHPTDGLWRWPAEAMLEGWSCR